MKKLTNSVELESKELVTPIVRIFIMSINVNLLVCVVRAWWDESSNAGVGPLHAMNPVRVKFIRHELAEKLGRQNNYVGDHIKGLDILDVGCGGGLLSESLARLGANVTGIDPSPDNIEVAEWHSKQDSATNRINYINTTVEEIADREKKFDAICSLEVSNIVHLHIRLIANNHLHLS
jgi:ubiquinone biosynthesis O-methyltransferase